jgi:hypothetical protein
LFRLLRWGNGSCRQVEIPRGVWGDLAYALAFSLGAELRKEYGGRPWNAYCAPKRRRSRGLSWEGFGRSDQCRVMIAKMLARAVLTGVGAADAAIMVSNVRNTESLSHCCLVAESLSESSSEPRSHFSSWAGHVAALARARSFP